MANSNIIYPQMDWDRLTRRQQLGLMDEYYSNNTLYENTRILRHYLGVWKEDMRPLRSPVHRSVEFFVAKVALGEPVVSVYNKKQAVADAIKNIMEWSNFQLTKNSQVRSMSKYGDLFRKVVSENGKVWHEMVETEDVTDFQQDPRGFLTEIRIDTPIKDGFVQKTRTEFWTVNDAIPYMAVWEHSLHENATIEQIAQAFEPVMYAPLSDFGIDFVPFVRSSFAEGVEKWGANCVEHALLKVDEANRQATRLHQMLFRYNKPVWLLSSNQVLDDGTPVPAPDVSNMEIRDDSIIPLGGNNTLNGLVPDIDYAAALSILKSQEEELEKDLPELRYYSVAERSDMTGKAIRNLLGAAVDRAEAARTSFAEGTVRLNQMAMTVGQFQGIFSGLGSFDDGQLNHSIRFADMFPSDISEKSTTLSTLAGIQGMPLNVAMKLAGFSDEEIDLLPQNDTVSIRPASPKGTSMNVTPDQMMQENQTASMNADQMMMNVVVGK